MAIAHSGLLSLEQAKPITRIQKLRSVLDEKKLKRTWAQLEANKITPRKFLVNACHFVEQFRRDLEFINPGNVQPNSSKPDNNGSELSDNGSDSDVDSNDPDDDTDESDDEMEEQEEMEEMEDGSEAHVEAYAEAESEDDDGAEAESEEEVPAQSGVHGTTLSAEEYAKAIAELERLQGCSSSFS